MKTREQIGQAWSSVAPGWARWEPYFAHSSQPVTQRLIAGLRLQPGMRVLDVGCGIGEPSLQIAGAIGSGGQVLGIDLSSDMIDVARARANALALNNAEFRAGAVEELAESTEKFDAIVARFSIIFFTDLAGGLKKLLSLLRPGGRIAVSTWTPMAENPMFDIPSSQFARVAPLPKTPPDAPGPLRLSKPGELGQALTDAGFADVEVTDVPFYNFAKNPEEYFELIYDMSPPLREQFHSLSESQRDDVRSGIIAEVSKHTDHNIIRVPAKARVAAACRQVS